MNAPRPALRDRLCVAGFLLVWLLPEAYHALWRAPLAIDHQAEELIDLDRALAQLGERDERLAQVVEMRFFAGLEVKDIAELLGVSEPTIKRDTRAAKAFLQKSLSVLPHPERANYVLQRHVTRSLPGPEAGFRRRFSRAVNHVEAYAEVESQGISYTAGVPPVAAALLIADGTWDARRMVNVEELDPEPFISLLDRIGLPTEYLEIEPGSAASFDGEVRSLDEELAHSTATVTVSAVDPMIAVRPR